MLKLHFAPNSRAVRTLWLLEELGLPYELNKMDFHPRDLKSDEHRNRHPLGRVPVLEDGDISIFESGAIADYILERHKNGGLKPAADAPNFPAYLQWFHYCEGTVMPPINTIVVQTIFCCRLNGATKPCWVRLNACWPKRWNRSKMTCWARNIWPVISPPPTPCWAIRCSWPSACKSSMTATPIESLYGAAESASRIAKSL